MNNRQQEGNTSLKRQLSPMHVWAIAFGCVIGWGSFINPGKKFLSNSGVAGTAIAMVLGALVMIIIAFSYAYMVPKYPKAGGEFTSAATLATSKRDGDGTKFLKVMATIGVVFSVIFMILQLVPIPGLNGVHFGKESYIMLIVWVAIGLVFYTRQRKFFTGKD